MRNHAVRLYLISSMAILLLTLVWGLRSIPKQAELSEATIRSSTDQELTVLSGATAAAVQALRYRLLDVLKAEGNDRATRTFRDSQFVAATLLEWDQTQWKSLWHSSKVKSQFQQSDIRAWMIEWPLAKLNGDETHFVKVGDWQGQPYFAMIAPVRKPNNTPLIGIGIFPAAQFGLVLPLDRTREFKVFDDRGYALALAKPAYLGSSLKREPVVEDILESGEFQVRREGKNSKSQVQYEAAARIAKTNLFIANTASLAPPVPFRLRSWLYLLATALGAILLNWYLFLKFNNQTLELLTHKDGVIESLKRQLESRPDAAAEPAPVIVHVDEVPPAPIAATPLANLEFIEPDTLPTAPELLKSVTLQKVVQAALKSLQPRIEEYSIRVAENGLQSIPVTTDALQLQTAIEEVLKNGIEAMQFSRERWLTITGHMHNGRVMVTVEDTGVGIAADNLSKVFDPFFSTKDSQGVARGLGLNVTRRVLEEMKGSVTIESHQSETATGTTVRMEWPLPNAAASQALPESALEAPASEAQVPLQVSELDLLAEAYAKPNTQTAEWPDVPVRKPIVRSMD